MRIKDISNVDFNNYDTLSELIEKNGGGLMILELYIKQKYI